jgi:hypothetical protein
MHRYRRVIPKRQIAHDTDEDPVASVEVSFPYLWMLGLSPTVPPLATLSAFDCHGV